MPISRSPDETMRIGRGYGRRAKSGDIYCLSGELGSGKTVFAKGFAEGLLGVTNADVASPTFTIVNEYAGRLPFFHLDVYRCGPDDMEDIGLDEYLYGGGVTLIEWAEHIRDVLPACCVWINISKRADDDDIRLICEIKNDGG